MATTVTTKGQVTIPSRFATISELAPAAKSIFGAAPMADTYRES